MWRVRTCGGAVGGERAHDVDRMLDARREGEASRRGGALEGRPPRELGDLLGEARGSAEEIGRGRAGDGVAAFACAREEGVFVFRVRARVRADERAPREDAVGRARHLDRVEGRPASRRGALQRSDARGGGLAAKRRLARRRGPARRPRGGLEQGRDDRGRAGARVLGRRRARGGGRQFVRGDERRGVRRAGRARPAWSSAWTSPARRACARATATKRAARRSSIRRRRRARPRCDERSDNERWQL